MIWTKTKLSAGSALLLHAAAPLKYFSFFISPSRRWFPALGCDVQIPVRTVTRDDTNTHTANVFLEAEVFTPLVRQIIFHGHLIQIGSTIRLSPSVGAVSHFLLADVTLSS
jgi:hypothetical protein